MENSSENKSKLSVILICVMGALFLLYVLMMFPFYGFLFEENVTISHGETHANSLLIFNILMYAWFGFLIAAAISRNKVFAIISVASVVAGMLFSMIFESINGYGLAMFFRALTGAREPADMLQVIFGMFIYFLNNFAHVLVSICLLLWLLLKESKVKKILMKVLSIAGIAYMALLFFISFSNGIAAIISQLEHSSTFVVQMTSNLISVLILLSANLLFFIFLLTDKTEAAPLFTGRFRFIRILPSIFAGGAALALQISGILFYNAFFLSEALFCVARIFIFAAAGAFGFAGGKNKPITAAPDNQQEVT